MGWLDKGFKNIVKGGKDLLSGPAGIMLLSAAAPWLSASLGGTGMMAKFGGTGLGKLMSSPWIKNALTNAAMQGGIATLTGSKHPWKAMGYSALASMPFTGLKAAQAAKAYNLKGGLKGDEAVNWWDFALDTDKVKDYLTIGAGDIGVAEAASDPKAFVDAAFSPKTVPAPTMEGFFTRDPSKLMNQIAGGKGIGSVIPALGLENIDLMAATVPQIAGMYGGRMTEEEQWLAGKEKQIRLWAFQHGIPYEEAKEIWKDGYKNPYYTTRTPKDYNFQFNKGGIMQYKDDYTAGGSAVGPGTGTSDSIRPVALSDGEFVFTEEATNNFPGGHEGLYSLMNSLDPNSERPQEARV